MSVAAIPSPASRCKRLFEEATEQQPPILAPYKRARAGRGSPTARQQHPFAASPHAEALAALLQLFPGMDEQVVEVNKAVVVAKGSRVAGLSTRHGALSRVSLGLAAGRASSAA
jgi:hypothetical protein